MSWIAMLGWYLIIGAFMGELRLACPAPEEPSSNTLSPPAAYAYCTLLWPFILFTILGMLFGVYFKGNKS